MIKPHVIIINENYADKRLDRILRLFYPQLPLSVIYKAIRNHKILVNGQKTDQKHKIQENDQLTINLTEAPKIPTNNFQKYNALPVNAPIRQHLKILLEDDDLLILDKPAGFAVHGGTGRHDYQTMVALASLHVQNSAFPPVPIHRLDKPTSGILVFAKNNRSLQNLNQQLRDKQTVKKYFALVDGKISENQGIIDLRLMRTESKIKNRKVIAINDHQQGQSALTSYNMRERFGNIATLLELQISTGRTHQIRVHLASTGHPVWGDEHYQDAPSVNIIKHQYGLKRLFLHACHFECRHPQKNYNLQIKSPLPSELNQTLKILRESMKSKASFHQR